MITVAFVFARGGSKGVPRKNLRLVGGVSLIERAVRTAQQVERISRVIVSTDDEEIADAGRRAGADVPGLRPAALAADGASELDAWRHALDWCLGTDGSTAFDTFVSVPPTAPLRIAADIDRCLDEYAAGGCDMVVTGTPAQRHPSFNMVQRSADGSVGLVMPPSGNVVRRQDAAPAFDLTTVAYVSSPDHIRRCRGVLDGTVRLVEVPRERAIDIDDEFDLTIADILASRSTT